MTVFDPPTGWNARLLSQLDFHWTHHVRAKLVGLTDDEYFWEPAADCWSVRPRGTERTELAGGSGTHVVEAAFPEPDPAPVTTIAWLLAHLIVPVLGQRNASHFGGPEMTFFGHDYAATAAGALDQLDDAYQRWVDGIAGLGDEGLEQTVGDAEGPYATHTYADLMLHVHRECIHHGAEILLLRSLHRSGDDRAARLSR